MLSNLFINRNYDTCINNVYEKKNAIKNNLIIDHNVCQNTKMY
jgi:hypothetical protein